MFVLTLIYCQTNAQTVSINFNVNLKYYIISDQFDPTTETVDIAGTFNGWGSTINMLSAIDTINNISSRTIVSSLDNRLL